MKLKYSEGYSSYRADKKSISNKTKGDNSKSKTARAVVLVSDTSSGPVLHFYQVSKIFQRVFDLQSGHKINGQSLSNITQEFRGRRHRTCWGKITGATIRTWLLDKFVSFLAVLSWKTGLKKM